MNCEHAYVPFPGSRRNLYCTFCGAGKDAFALTSGGRANVRQPRAGKATSQANSPAEVAQPSLFDADADDATDILSDRRAKRELETRTREIIGQQNPDLSEMEVESVVADVMRFGPEIDLDAFAASVAGMTPRETREPVDETDDNLGRGAGL